MYKMKELLARISGLVTLSTGMTGNKKEMAERVERIAKKPKIRLVAVAMSIVAAVIACMAACAEADESTLDGLTPGISETEQGPETASPEAQATPQNSTAAAFIPLDSLPAGYSTEAAIADGCYVNIHGTEHNAEKLDAFYEYTKERPEGGAFIRIVSYTVEGDAIITDCAYQDGVFTVTEDSSRDRFAGSGDRIRRGTFDYIHRYVLNGDQVYYIVSDYDTVTSPDVGIILSYRREKAAMPKFDRTDPQQVITEFLTVYFDKLCTGNDDMDWDGDRKTWLNGLIKYDEEQIDWIACLKQWLSMHKLRRAHGADTEAAVGRFESLSGFELREGGAASAYFKTTAFGTLIEAKLVKLDNSEYAMTRIDFPDSKEYKEFQALFARYKKEHNAEDPFYEDYTKELEKEYAAGLELLEQMERERNAWKKGERICAGFARAGGEIMIGEFGAAIDTNSTQECEADEKWREGHDADGIRYYTRNGIDTWLFAVQRIDLSEKEYETQDLISYCMDMTMLGCASMYSADMYAPETLLGSGTKVKAMARMMLQFSFSESGRDDDSQEYVETAYLIQLKDNDTDVLCLRFLNAYKAKNTAAWKLLQSEYDCEAWLKTLVF